jgi:hypothetical protein
MPNVAGNEKKFKQLQQHANDCTSHKNNETVFLAAWQIKNNLYS